MVGRDLLYAKADAVKKHVSRAKSRGRVGLEVFLQDPDRQDIVLFNLQLAVQNCIDMAAHIISDKGLGVPGSNNDMFYLLEENDWLDTPLVEKMIKAVGFRNHVVHEYGKLDLSEVHHASQHDTQDLLDYVRAVLAKIG